MKLKEIIKINNDFQKYIGYQEALAERGINELWNWRMCLFEINDFYTKLKMKKEYDINKLEKEIEKQDTQEYIMKLEYNVESKIKESIENYI